MNYKDYLEGVSGLVGLWNLDETSGTVAVDQIAGRNGTYEPGAGSFTLADRVLSTYSPANVELTGGGDVNIPTNAAFSSHAGAGGLLSIIASVYHTANSAAQMLVTKSNSSGPGGEYQLRVESDGSVLFGILNAAASGSIMECQSAAGACPLNDEALILATYDRANARIKIYVNGTEVASSTSASSTSVAGTANLYIGERSDGGGNTWEGNVGHVGIFNRELSSAEAADLWTAFNEPTPSIVPVVAYWGRRLVGLPVALPMIIAGGNIGTAGGQARLASSPDGTSGSWELITTPIDGEITSYFSGIAFNGTRFAAGGWANGSPGGSRIITSEDGINWTERATPIDSNVSWHLADLIWVEDLGLFVAIVWDGSATKALLSSDGITWVAYTFTFNGGGQGQNVIWDGTKLVATSNAGGIDTSTDGQTWTQVHGASDPMDSIVDIVWAEELSLYVCVGSGIPFNHRGIFTSPDLVTWTERAVGETGIAIGWNGSVFVAVGYSGGSWWLYTSTNGTSWTSRTHVFTGSVSSYDGAVYWTGSFWIASVLPSTGSVGVASSPDGVTWTAETTPLLGIGKIASNI